MQNLKRFLIFRYAPLSHLSFSRLAQRSRAGSKGCASPPYSTFCFRKSISRSRFKAPAKNMKINAEGERLRGDKRRKAQGFPSASSKHCHASAAEAQPAERKEALRRVFGEERGPSRLPRSSSPETAPNPPGEASDLALQPLYPLRRLHCHSHEPQVSRSRKRNQN